VLWYVLDLACPWQCLALVLVLTCNMLSWKTSLLCVLPQPCLKSQLCSHNLHQNYQCACSELISCTCKSIKCCALWSVITGSIQKVVPLNCIYDTPVELLKVIICPVCNFLSKLLCSWCITAEEGYLNCWLAKVSESASGLASADNCWHPSFHSQVLIATTTKALMVVMIVWSNHKWSRTGPETSVIWTCLNRTESRTRYTRA